MQPGPYVPSGHSEDRFIYLFIIFRVNVEVRLSGDRFVHNIQIGSVIGSVALGRLNSWHLGLESDWRKALWRSFMDGFKV